MTLARTTNGRSLPAEILTEGGELLDLREQPTALEAITRAEIDIQIATAKHYPRDFPKFVRTAKAMVQSDPDLAAACTYVLPARKKGDDPISGPSVRLAEIVAVCWGNLRIVGRLTDDDGKFVTAQGVAIDLEANVGYSTEVRVGVTYGPKSYSPGQRFGDDMVKTTSNRAIAVATRNATFKVVPRAFVNLIQEEADRVARGDVKSIPDRAARAFAWFAGKGIPEARVTAALGVTSRDEITLDLLQTLNGYKTAVSDGMSTLDEIFAPKEAAPPPEVPKGAGKSAELAGKIKGGKRPTPEPEPKPEDLPQVPPVEPEDASQDDGDVDIPEGF